MISQPERRCCGPGLTARTLTQGGFHFWVAQTSYRAQSLQMVKTDPACAWHLLLLKEFVINENFWVRTPRLQVWWRLVLSELTCLLDVMCEGLPLFATMDYKFYWHLVEAAWMLTIYWRLCGSSISSSAAIRCWLAYLVKDPKCHQHIDGRADDNSQWSLSHPVHAWRISNSGQLNRK
jgi:hypothetical protein